MTNQFHGGKILPESGTAAPIDGNIPLHMITGVKKDRRTRTQRMAEMERSSASQPQDAPKSERERRLEIAEADFDMCMKEIEERRVFLEDMGKQHGERRKKIYERDMQNQIAEYVRRAKKLDEEIRKLSTD